jgi:hypothetical protein
VQQGTLLQAVLAAEAQRVLVILVVLAVILVLEDLDLVVAEVALQDIVVTVVLVDKVLVVRRVLTVVVGVVGVAAVTSMPAVPVQGVWVFWVKGQMELVVPVTLWVPAGLVVVMELVGLREKILAIMPALAVPMVQAGVETLPGLRNQSGEVEVLAQSVLSGPEPHVHSHQRIQGIYNGTFY